MEASQSLPSMLELSSDPVNEDSFQYKSRKLRSAAKTLTDTDEYRHPFTPGTSRHKQQPRRNYSECRLQLDPKEGKTNRKKLYSNVNRGPDPVPLRTEKHKPKLPKKPLSLELNLFQKKMKISRSTIAHSTTLEPLHISSHGFLLLKRKSKKPKRALIVLSGNFLQCYRCNVAEKDEPSEPMVEIPLEYATIRQDAECKFSIITPDSQYSFQGEYPEEIEKWVNNLKEKCKKLVMDTISVDESENSTFHHEIWWMASANTCADCGDTNPEWVSLNLGIFICSECSAIHRSFGTHISQVKSVRLGRWSEEEVNEMKNRGNKNSNKIWEFSVPPRMERITNHSSREARVKWLTKKYILGTFKDGYVSTGPIEYSGKDSAQEQMKTMLLESLEEDVAYAKNLAVLVFNLS